MSKHAGKYAKPKKRWPKVVGALLLVVITVALAAVAVVVLVRPAPAIAFLEARGVSVPVVLSLPGSSDAGKGSSSTQGADAPQGSSGVVREGSASGQGTRGRASDDAGTFGVIDDKGMSSEEAADQAQRSKLTQQTPLLARCSGVDLRSPVSMAELTGILFHQASYHYALPLETEVPAANYETVADTRTFRINHDQVTEDGSWADTEILYIWRTTDVTDVNTSIDVGAFPGTTVKSPVSGTVVLVRDYKLYDEVDDVEVHIEPTGRHDLDCVLIHVVDPRVKAGDKVEAGLTDIASIRDIESSLTDVQLGFFTPEGVGGNHTHVQVNNANEGDYREKKLEGAITAQ